MPEQPPEIRRSLFQRRTSRRALLGGVAAVVAAGGAATAGVVIESDRPSKKPSWQAGVVSQASQALDPNQPISDAKQRAAHLLRRAGFGGTLAQIEEFSQLSREEAADRLINYEQVDNLAMETQLAQLNIDLNQPRPAELMLWWLTRMVYTSHPLEERMTYIWHGLLTSQLSTIGGERAKLMIRQNQLYRTMALPKFDDLIKEVSRDPAMLIYLNNVESVKAHPNENYARELMELFTLGVGNYSETDVRENARAFTGWRFTLPQRTAPGPKGFDYANWDPQFYINPRLHDDGMKTFLGQTGNFGGDDTIDIIMQQPAAGAHIATRLFSELANRQPSAQTMANLVKVWDSSGHDIKAMVRAILTSDEFYSQGSYRALVRSPVDFMVSALIGLETLPNLRRTVPARAVQAMNQVLFEPPNVAGWPGGPAWLSSGTFFARANFLDQVLFGRGKVPPPIPAFETATTPTEMVDRALAIFLDGQVPAASRQAIINHVQTLSTPAEQAATAAYLVLASPEFQLV